MAGAPYEEGSMCTPDRSWSRRRFLTSSASAAALIPGFQLPAWTQLESSARPHLDVALEAWRWIDRSRVRTDHGITWPADPMEPRLDGATLYSDAPGVLPFALELFHTTQDEMYLAAAREGADHLAAMLDDPGVAGLGSGFYVGVGGLAFVFEEVFRASGDAKYRGLAGRALGQMLDSAVEVGDGIAWPQGQNEVTDIVSGAAGTGLTLLWLFDRLGDERALAAADAAGRRLVEIAEPADTGRRWQLFPGMQREYPNFSHGTGGVAYFLATLAARTGDRDLLGAATDGAHYLQSLANLDNGGYRILHYTPEGEDRFYLSWCHGPAGTNRLFYRLWEATGEETWLDWVHSGARGIMNSGVPEERTAGFWENISQCGGEAGLGEFFLAFGREAENQDYLDYVDRLNASLLRRSTHEYGGRKWAQAENRVSPDVKIAQTGFMQGAAGVGKYFLHVDSMVERFEGPAITLPDAPY